MKPPIQCFWEKQFLETELFECIAMLHTIPSLLENTGLSPIFDTRTVTELASKASPNSGRVRFADAGSFTYSGPTLATVLSAPNAVNTVRERSTLVVNSVDRLCDQELPDLQFIKALFMEIFGTSLCVNAYLGHNGSTGFGMHYDDHDVLIWQQSGSKHWEVRDNLNRTTLLQTTISAGSLLYIPQGFYHAAQTPEDDESLHLTFGFNRQYKDFRNKKTTVDTSLLSTHEHLENFRANRLV